MREGRPPGMAGDRQGPRPKRAKGQENSTEGSRDQMTSAVLTCVHAGRRVPQGRMHSGKGRGQAKKKNRNHKAPPEGVKHRASRQRGNGKERKGRRGTAGGVKKKQQQVTRWGKGTSTRVPGAAGAGPGRRAPTGP